MCVPQPEEKVITSKFLSLRHMAECAWAVSWDLFFPPGMLILSQWSPGNNKYLTVHPETSLEIRTIVINLILGAKDWKWCFSNFVQSASLQKRCRALFIKGSSYKQSKQFLGFSVYALAICDWLDLRRLRRNMTQLSWDFLLSHRWRRSRSFILKPTP